MNIIEQKLALNNMNTNRIRAQIRLKKYQIETEYWILNPTQMNIMEQKLESNNMVMGDLEDQARPNNILVSVRRVLIGL